MSATTDNKPSLGDIVSAAGVAIGLLTAWLYVAGWSYAYTYFDRFHIPLLMLDIPLEHMLVYGGLVVRKNIWLALLCGILLLAILTVLVRWAARLGRFLVSTIIVLLAITLFTLARVGGNAAALQDFAQQRATDYSAYPRVRVTWEGKEAPPDTVTADILKSDCGRLLAASNTNSPRH